MRSANIVIGVVAALALAGGGFAAGMTFERAQAPATPTTTTATTTTGGRGGSGARGGSGPFVVGNVGGQQPVVGRVLAVNDGSITVAAIDRGQGQNAQGASASPATTSQIVLVGASTRIVKTTETDVKLGDIKVNDQVTVVGTPDTTGMVSATAIVVGSTNVLGQLFGSQTGNPGGRPGASASPTKTP
jgi:hypothetical protein